MVKAHSSIGWKNDPSTDTPLNETNLNKMDNTIGVLDDRIIVLDSTKATKTEVSTLIADISFNENTGIFTFTKKNGSTFTVDTKLEKLAINFAYDETNERLVITLSDGTVQYVDISSLIRLQEFVDSDTIAFTVTTNSVTARIKENSITEEMLESGYLGQIKLEVETAEESAANAKVSEENAKVSELNAKASEENAKASEIEADNLAQEIKSKVSEANASATNASTHANAAQESANLASTKANEASASATLASEKSNIAVSNASDAEQFASNAEQHATDAEASSVNAEASAVRAEEAAKKAETIAGGDYASNEKVDNIINGTTPVGNANKLGGKDASEYALGKNVTIVTEFPSGITNNSTMKELISALPDNSIFMQSTHKPIVPNDYSSLLVFKCNGNYAFAYAFCQLDSNEYVGRLDGGANWSGWFENATTADLANYLPLSGGMINGTFALMEFVNVYANSSNAETYSSFIQNANGTHVRHVTDANNFDEVFIKQGKITYAKMANGAWSETDILHTGNVGSQSVNYANSAGSVAWGNVSGRPSSMPASDVYSWAKASSKPSYTKAEVGLGNVDNTADSAKSVKYATIAGSAPASDVYSWAKASSKPSYSWSEITSKPSSFTPTSHTHTASQITGTVPVTISSSQPSSGLWVVP